MDDAERALAEAERVLRQNWREGERDGHRLRLHRPSPGRYPWQWYWDSCFAAIVWRRFDPDRSRAELESLLAAQRPDGFIGHTIFWDRPVSWIRLRLLQRRHRAARCRPRRSSRRCSPGPGGSPSATRPRSRGSAPRPTGWPPTATSRATACSGSSSPTSRGSTPRPSSNRSGDGAPTAASASRCLVERNRRLGFDARRIRDRGGPVLCETLVNTIWSLSLQALGRPSATPALVERLWDERRGLFLDEVQPGGLRPAAGHLGRAWRRWRCPTCPRRSAGGWSRSTC